MKLPVWFLTLLQEVSNSPTSQEPLSLVYWAQDFIIYPGVWIFPFSFMFLSAAAVFQQDLDVVEFFCGVGSIWKAAAAQGMASFALHSAYLNMGQEPLSCKLYRRHYLSHFPIWGFWHSGGWDAWFHNASGLQDGTQSETPGFPQLMFSFTDAQTMSSVFIHWTAWLQKVTLRSYSSIEAKGFGLVCSPLWAVVRNEL